MRAGLGFGAELRPLQRGRVEAAVRQSVFDVVEVGDVGVDLLDLPIVVVDHVLLCARHVVQLRQLPVQIAVGHLAFGVFQGLVNLVELAQIYSVDVACRQTTPDVTKLLWRARRLARQLSPDWWTAAREDTRKLLLPSWSSRAVMVFRTILTALFALRALSSASLALSEA